jgi:hypothetical protein
VSSSESELSVVRGSPSESELSLVRSGSPAFVVVVVALRIGVRLSQWWKVAVVVPRLMR